MKVISRSCAAPCSPPPPLPPPLPPAVYSATLLCTNLCNPPLPSCPLSPPPPALQEVMHQYRGRLGVYFQDGFNVVEGVAMLLLIGSGACKVGERGGGREGGKEGGHTQGGLGGGGWRAWDGRNRPALPGGKGAAAWLVVSMPVAGPPNVSRDVPHPVYPAPSPPSPPRLTPPRPVPPLPPPTVYHFLHQS